MPRVLHRLGAAGISLVEIAACLLMIALLASVTLGVVFRTIGQPLVWSDEMAQYLLVWTGFAGWIIAGRRGSHIRITVFIDRLPRGARLALEGVIQLAMIVLALALLWYSPAIIRRNLDIEWVSLPLSAAILYFPVPVAAFALVLESLGDLVALAKGRLPRGAETGGQVL
ncbi:MAG TPA: TRAP transporter small permease [Rhabdaerophilum sp.]|nr:TRAP transporter small permease [Rhabdaerophilum sp.]